MKILHKVDNNVIAIYDDKNYVLYDSSRPKVSVHKQTGKETTSYEYSYFSKIDAALRELCRRTADERCGNLQGWMREYKGVMEMSLEVYEGGLHD